MSDIHPLSYREHARLSIAHHMTTGQAKGLSGIELERYIRLSCRMLSATGEARDDFESELRRALNPRKPRVTGPKPHDLPGQQTMFDVPPTRRKK